MAKQTKIVRIEEVLEGTLLEDIDFQGVEDDITYDQLQENIEERISEEEIIYSSNAMDFLSEHDIGLQTSMEIAQDMGYEPKDINSELLATILKQQMMREELYRYKSEIEEIIDDDEDE